MEKTVERLKNDMDWIKDCKDEFDKSMKELESKTNQNSTDITVINAKLEVIIENQREFHRNYENDREADREILKDIQNKTNNSLTNSKVTSAVVSTIISVSAALIAIFSKIFQQ